TREDDVDISHFAVNDSNLYFVERCNDYHRIGIIDSENMYGSFSGELNGFEFEGDVRWRLRTGLWGLDLPVNKYYNSFVVRGRGEKGANLKVCYSVNSSEDFVECAHEYLDKTGSFTIHINSPRCDHIQFLFEGKGDVTIFSIMRNMGVGSDVYV
ncbi:MAG: hypothetical protein IKV44_06600, partial [Clostridia bacterium]|nr:hypothetical protein [Clostridia bacterium]